MVSVLQAFVEPLRSFESNLGQKRTSRNRLQMSAMGHQRRDVYEACRPALHRTMSKSMSPPIAPATHRLACYGTLAPGRANNHQLSGLRGRWIPGTVTGRLVAEGWGAEHGFPGLILGASEAKIEVSVFESLDLPNHWQRLDAFEGDGYRRVKTDVQTPEGLLPSFIYVIDR